MSGHTRSCGCAKGAMITESKITHNLSKIRIYRIYHEMIARCFDKKKAAFKDYGKRGITVCEEWRNDFKVFYNWAMANGYKEDLTIDRIDVNGNYEPDNCRWVSKKVQARNTRQNHLITYKGKTHCISEWAEIYGIKPSLLGTRIRCGWSFTKAVKTSPEIYKNRANKLIEYQGQYKTLKEWTETLQIHSTTFYRKLKAYRQGLM